MAFLSFLYLLLFPPLFRATLVFCGPPELQTHARIGWPIIDRPTCSCLCGVIPTLSWQELSHFRQMRSITVKLFVNSGFQSGAIQALRTGGNWRIFDWQLVLLIFEKHSSPQVRWRLLDFKRALLLLLLPLLPPFILTTDWITSRMSDLNHRLTHKLNHRLKDWIAVDGDLNRSQWALPDLNRQLHFRSQSQLIAVSDAWPDQPRPNCELPSSTHKQLRPGKLWRLQLSYRT